MCPHFCVIVTVVAGFQQSIHSSSSSMALTASKLVGMTPK
jgi:hypothetical protein